jgi:ABC-type multidrug transport system permease subunit
MDSMGEKEYIIQNNKSNSTNSNSKREMNYQIVGLICLLFMASIVLFLATWYSAKR